MKGAAFLQLATFNINGIVRRLGNLLAWLESAQPDVVCLQEIKCKNSDFPHRELKAAGYGAIWKGQGPNHGVAILARNAEPMEVRRVLPGDERDLEARYIEAAVDGLLICCLYLPNGNPKPGPKFEYKLAWFERFIAHASTLIDSGAPVLMLGDYNVVPSDDVRDIYNVRSWKKNALLQPEPRAAYARLLAQGWTDTLRSLHPDLPTYTFWDYMRDSWARDAGMRLDHLLVSPSLKSRIVDANVDRIVRAGENASDHAPVWLTLSDN